MRTGIHLFQIQILCCFSSAFISSCTTKAYNDEELSFAPTYLNIFKALTKKDTIYFLNAAGESKTFVIPNIDSTVRNVKGGFMNDAPYKSIRFTLKQIGNDTCFLERGNLIFISKNPTTNKTSIGIQINNLFFNDTVLPPIRKDILDLNTKKFSNYYSFATSLEPKRLQDIRILYVDTIQGFLGFKTFSDEIWTAGEKPK